MKHSIGPWHKGQGNGEGVDFRGNGPYAIWGTRDHIVPHLQDDNRVRQKKTKPTRH